MCNSREDLLPLYLAFIENSDFNIDSISKQVQEEVERYCPLDVYYFFFNFYYFCLYFLRFTSFFNFLSIFIIRKKVFLFVVFSTLSYIYISFNLK